MRKRNWKQYNKQLVQRGSLTFLLDPRSLKPKRLKGKIGRPLVFSNEFIQMLLLIKIQYHLPYRALEGFVKWVFQKAYPTTLVPSYSIVCKRVAKMECVLPNINRTRSETVLVDASGLKVLGEGEWKVKIHGKNKRRKWLKLHVALDAYTQEIVAEISTDGSTADCRALEPLLNQIPSPIATVIGDGAYDKAMSRKILKKNRIRDLIPPPKNARYRGKDDERDLALLTIKGLGGDLLARRLWGKLSGYSQRALVETCFSRFKRLFGERMFSKIFDKQRVENTLKCMLLNQMLTFGT
jgi:hypothetical protein